jgi:hypothetical protein
LFTEAPYETIRLTRELKVVMEEMDAYTYRRRIVVNGKRSLNAKSGEVAID